MNLKEFVSSTPRQVVEAAQDVQKDDSLAKHINPDGFYRADGPPKASPAFESPRGGRRV